MKLNTARMTVRILAATAFAVSLAGGSAIAQQTARVAGKIERVEGSTLVVKGRDGSEMKVNLTPKARVFGVVKATLADVRAGAFVGVGAMPQSDGSQRAVQVMIFTESLRGTGEGHRPWTRPGSTMTNATVDTIVASVDGQVLMVKYKDGEKKVVVPSDAVIRRYIDGTREELRAGADIAINNAVKKDDGTFEASRINVGREGIVP